MGGPTGAREIGPHRGGGGKREKAISPGRGGAGEEIVNAHLSLGLEIIPIVHRNYDGWTNSLVLAGSPPDMGTTSSNPISSSREMVWGRRRGDGTIVAATN